MGSSVGCASELLLTPEPGPLPQNTKWRNIAFSFWGIFLEFVWSDVVALLLKGFLGTVAVSNAGLTVLEACELLSRHMVACSGARAVDCFRKISSDKQNFVVLVSGVWPRWRNKFSNLLCFFSKCKHRDENEFDVFHLSDIMT